MKIGLFLDKKIRDFIVKYKMLECENNLYDENSCDSKPLKRLYNKVKKEMEEEQNGK